MAKTNDPLFDIVSYNENDNGTAEVEINFSDEFIELYKKATGKTRATKKGLEKFLETILTDVTNKK